jgi:upstream activation factor subunit UAF30
MFRSIQSRFGYTFQPRSMAAALFSSLRRGRPPLAKTNTRTVPMTAATSVRRTTLNTRVHKLSAPLAEVCGKPNLPRTEVTKGIWRYIKKNDLQKTSAPRIVKCDPLLKKVFNRNEVEMLEIGKRIQKHILEPVVKDNKKH